MSFRATFVLVAIAVLLGGYMALAPDPAKEDAEAQPWFFLLDDSKIDKLAIEYFGDSQTYVRDNDRTWHFATLDGPKVGCDFAGAAFLASGAKSPRLISDDPEAEPSQFGLADPQIQLGIGVEDGEEYQVLIGNRTPDGVNNYAMFEGVSQIYLVDRTWGEFMARLVVDPPHDTGEDCNAGDDAGAFF